MSPALPRTPSNAVMAAVGVVVALIVAAYMAFGSGSPGDPSPEPGVTLGDGRGETPRTGGSGPGSSQSSARPSSAIEEADLSAVDPAITVSPPTPVTYDDTGKANPSTSLPWAEPQQLPAPLDADDDPGLAYSPPLLPAALDSDAGRAVYRFVMAFHQLYPSRPQFESEWQDRFAPFCTEEARARFVSAKPMTWGMFIGNKVSVYHPQVTKVVVWVSDPHSLVVELSIARQTAPPTAAASLSGAHVVTWRVSAALLDEKWLVIDQLDVTNYYGQGMGA